jgi:hypothetical protein
MKEETKKHIYIYIYIYKSKIIGYGSLDAVLSVETKKEFERRREK